MANAQQTLAGGLHGRTGSFYVDDLDAESRRRLHAFSAAAAAPHIVAGVLASAGIASGSGYTRVYNRTIPWSADTIVAHGQNIVRRARVAHPSSPMPLIPTTGARAGKNAAHILTRMNSLFSDGIMRYGIALPDGLYPETIDGISGTLVSGVDFDVYDGFLVTRLDPMTEFPNGLIHMTAGMTVAPVPAVYPSSGGAQGRAAERMFYHRSGQSVWAFERAAAEAAGLYVQPYTDVVVDVYDAEDATIYLWLSGDTTRVAYPHTRLAPGTKVEGGTVLSGTPRFSMRVARSADDYGDNLWDIDMLKPGVIAAPGSEEIDTLLSDYAGRVILVDLGATLTALGPEAVARAKAYIVRNRPLSSFIAFKTYQTP